MTKHDTTLITAAHHLHDADVSANICYWAKDEGTYEHHLDNLHKRLAEAARVLGYALTPLAGAEPKENDTAE
jgi:hypothetical protein